MLHVRELISNLSYDKLLQYNLIPDLHDVILDTESVVAVKRYPPFVYQKQDFSFFGMLLDYIIRAGFRINLEQKINLGIEPNLEQIQTLPEEEMIDLICQLNIYESSKNVYDIVKSALKLVNLMYGRESYSQEQLQGYVPTLINIMKELVVKFRYYQDYLNGEIKYNTEYNFDNITAHPDIVTDECVLDIKTTCSFSKMSKEACLQVLTYYCLIKLYNADIKYVGFILPMQRTIFVCDVSGWEYHNYLQLIIEKANVKEPKIDNNISLSYLLHIKYRIGSHYPKGKNLAETLESYVKQYPNTPCQMFLGNNRNGRKSDKTENQLDAARDVIKKYNLQYFTHAAYVINLCANMCDETEDYWQQRILNEDLRFTSKMGGKGVVVHTGARKEKSEEDALNTMELMIRNALEYATEECKLLLETPVGEGTEITVTLEGLGDFFYRFSADERKKLGVCIDLCHVFSASYDPLEYLIQWEQKYPDIKISLVHFNDSKGVCGCKVDRHEIPGRGHIGLEKMLMVAEFCYFRNIPMVRE
jgi:deoxyribonuclease-4